MQTQTWIVLGAAIGAAIYACGSGPAPPTAPTPGSSPSPASGLAFGAYVNVHGATRSSVGEPTLRISRDGWAVITDLGPTQVWQSSDRGATWALTTPPSFGGGDFDAVRDEAGRLHAVDLTRTCVLYYRSPDGGKTFDIVRSTHGGGVWVDGNGACVASSDRIDRPWVATFGSDRVYVVYKEDGSTGVDVSVDGGQTFQHAPPFSFPEAQGFAVDPVDGSIYVIAEEIGAFDSVLGRSTAHGVRVAASADGRTFSSALVFQNGQADLASGGFASIAVDAAHNVYAAWSDNSAGTTDVYVSVSRTRGATWSAPVRVSQGLVVSAFPTLTAGDAGRFGVAWYGTADPAKAYNNAPGASWYVYGAISINAADSSPTFETVKVNDQAFHHDSMCPHVDVCEGVDTTGSDRPPDYARKQKILDFFRTAVDSTGAMNVVWADTNNPLGEDHFARQTSGSLLKTASVAPSLTAKITRINSFARKVSVESRETTIAESELNTYLSQLAREQLSAALVDPTATLLDAGRVVLRADVQGARRMPLVVEGAIDSGNGAATFAIDSVVLDGLAVTPPTLESMLKMHLESDGRFDWHLTSAFPLPAGIRALRIARGRLTVIQ